MKRYLWSQISEDLKSKMVFIGGPRQVGKTTLAVSFLPSNSKTDPGYFTWDNKAHRSAIVTEQIPTNLPLIVLDEIHKYKRWRNTVKGFFDVNYPNVNYLVTGSARLDLYRHGGDSLQGRYFYHRLHPLSLMEINSSPKSGDLEQLLKLGGFPEPFLKGSETFARRWRRNTVEKVFDEDISSLETVQEIALLELLFDTLPDRTSSPLSYRSISKDLEVASATVSRWIDIFDKMYLTFRIAPYGEAKIRAVKREQKLYFWDWTHIQKQGDRFENFVACQLLKYCHHTEDTEGHKMELRFLRDAHGREIDFIVLRNRKPEFAVECKFGEKEASPACEYFRTRTKIPRFYQVHTGTKDFGNEQKSVRVLPFITFARELGLP